MRIILILAICMQMIGCGSKDGNDGADAGSEGNAAAGFVAEDLSLPHEYILNEAVFQNTLYYLYFERAENEADGGESTMYRLDMEQEGAVPVVVPVSLGENDNIIDMTVDMEGLLNLLIFKYDPEDDKLTDALWVRLDEAGTVVDSCSVMDVFRGLENQYATGFETDVNGNVYIANESQVSVVNREGQVIYQAACGGYVNTLCRDRDGRVYALWYGDSGLTMAIVDSAAKALGARHELSWLGTPVGAGTGTDGGLVLASESGIFDYDLETKSYTERFRWAPLDVVVDYYGEVLPLADGRILWIGKDYSNDGINATFTVIRPRAAGEAAPKEKQTLTFGGISMFIEADVKEAIVNFNRSNEDYRIEIKEYGADDIAVGLEQLNADIAGGNAPDIIALPLRMSMKLYAEKGVLEDLYPYLDRDETLAREELQENIVQAYEVGGKLYGMPISYMVDTLVGKKSLLGDRHSWNMDEMIAFVDSLEPGSQVFMFASKSGVLDLCLRANGDSIVTQSDGALRFNREFYSKVLEFANRFIDDEQFLYDDDEEILGLIDENQVHLMDNSVYDFSFYQLAHALFGEAVTYVGYPSDHGGGSMATSTSVIAINSQCADKETAWQFISSMLAEDFQANAQFMGFPIRKSGLEKKIERDMEKSYTTDENGNQQEVPKGSVSMGEITIDMYAAKEEEVQEIRKMIDSVDKISDLDDQVLAIISEESQAYFNGSKSAEEVADVVDNRIQLYLSETGE